MIIFARLARFRPLLLCVALVPAFAIAATTEVVSNGSFEMGMTSWTVAPSTDNPGATTCSVTSVVASGAEVVTSTPGFTADNGSNIALGSNKQTTNDFSIVDCVLYQDVVIPVGATTANFSLKVGQKQSGGKDSGDMAYRAGLYSTATVPYSTDTGNFVAHRSVATDVAFVSSTAASVNVSAYAGTTARFALFISSKSTTGAAVIGFDSVSLVVTSPDLAVPTSVPTLSEWGLIVLSGFMAIAAFAMRRHRKD
ncbi:IPTL-CTERM sorting domain-containing protein [Curvibacter sp. RS43]|uniref:IPTL-CTERM sorting domain-containing protein n=1 Tax=Curvibacter microcysteis TaxID=3026419 RepID=UPI002361E193|nr:IPTL-CTERM sorting domain-containing protein [Curvibacter sp. RS43]MDD0812901.1 IPTL-CTERM sorting domain-containing protein [Curvibacter sp. RS43]